MEQQIRNALAYFSNVDHTDSFELMEGTGAVLLSAPHATLQTRNGSLKYAERFTGMLCRMLHERIGYSVIYKTRHLHDDANFDPESDYRDAMCRFINLRGIRYVLDLHQMKPERETELCIGTGCGKNLLGQSTLAQAAAGCFQRHGVRSVTVDDPFTACFPHTVCATVAARCAVPALLLELNTRLLMQGDEAYRFPQILDALCELTDMLDRLPEAKQPGC